MYDEQAVTELELYTQNTGELYQKRISPYLDNLSKKEEKGMYDEEKAQKGYYSIVNESAKMYNKEFGSSGSMIFTPRDKKEVAKRLEMSYRDEIKER